MHGADYVSDMKDLGIKDLTDAKVQSELKDDAAFKSIKEGIKKDDKTFGLETMCVGGGQGMAMIIERLS